MGERNFHLHGNSFNRRAIGTEYETLACEYLTRHGYQILCRNFRCRQGEIDIIARDRDYLVFIEVKYRRDEHEGDPAEAVDARKQARILRTARYYMTRYHISEDMREFKNCTIRFEQETEKGCDNHGAYLYTKNSSSGTNYPS